MQYVIIDESGRLGDLQSRILVFAAIATNSLVGLDKIIPKVKKKLPVKGSRKTERVLAEIKFSKTGDKTRKAVLKIISQQKIKIFLLIIDTQGRKVADTPENYSLAVATLLSKIKRNNPELKHMIIDRHFTWVYQREKFNQLIQKRLKHELFIEHLDSQQNTIVSLADFVAGGIYAYYTKNIKKWKKTIERKIVYERRIFWKDLKGKEKR